MRTRVRKSAAAAQQVYRLTDIEVDEVSIVDRAANQKKFVMVKSATAGAPVVPDGAGGLTTEGDVDKAVWTTAYINNLPDSSFLYIEPGGTKTDGKTEPKSLRHFPVRDANGNVDLPHLRNALARIPQSNVPQAAKDKATAEAQRMLAAANKADPQVDRGTEPPTGNEPPGPQTEPTIRLSPEAKAELTERLATASKRLGAISKVVEGAETVAGLVEIPADLIMKIGELLTGIEQGALAKAEAVAKGLPQFSSSRVGALTAARDALNDLLGQVAPKPAEEPPAAQPPALPQFGEEFEKRLSALEGQIAKAIGGLTTIVAKQGEAITKQAQRVESIDRGVKQPNGSEAVATAPVTKTERDEDWDLDMASPGWGRKLPAD
jgi:uncharacterized coiled-coil protein SlyX